MRFTWDPNKAKSNLKKHGVSFEEAATAFGDPLAQDMPDPGHSDEEDRSILIGESSGQRIVVVWLTERPRGTIRIIGAREAEPRERRAYEEG